MQNLVLSVNWFYIKFTTVHDCDLDMKQWKSISKFYYSLNN